MENDNTFNETIQDEFLPQITSTTIKDKKKKPSPGNFNFEDSVTNACKYTDKRANTNQFNNESVRDLCKYYGKMTVQLNFQEDLLFQQNSTATPNGNIFTGSNLSNTSSSSSSITNLSNYQLAADSKDEEYFRQRTNPIAKLNLNDYATTAVRSRPTIDCDKENHRRTIGFRDEISTCDDSDRTLNDSSNIDISAGGTGGAAAAVEGAEQQQSAINMTYIDNIMDNNEDTKLHDVTKLAYELQNIDNNRLQAGVGQASKPLTVLSNRIHLIWTGVPVQNNESKPKYEEIRAWLQHNQIIKSFKLHLKAEKPQFAEIRIISPSTPFHFTNQSGTNYQKSITGLLEPYKDRKFYVVFHPTNSSYHMAHIVVTLEDKRFKMYLFGYAEAARVELLHFQPSSNPQNPAKLLLIRDFVNDNRSKKIQLFNSGAHTGFVSFYSHQQQVRFQPRSFLMVSKTTKEIKVTSISPVDVITFFFLYCDEELRRACRISCTTFPHQDKYNLFNVAHIFTILPEEKDIQQCKLPEFDWRPSLIRQLDGSVCYCNINLMPAISKSTRPNCVDFDITDFKLTLNEASSVRTIDRQTSQSSVTGNSTLTNIENLNSKPMYMNSVSSYIDSINSLTAIVIQKNENYFPPTVIYRTSYTGILIRNDNIFQVQWVISDMFLMSSNNSPDTCSSRYSLSSWSGTIPDSCMTVTMFKGTLKPGDSVLVPVAFKPTVVGRLKCKCNVKVLKDNSDSFMEKELDFYGKGIAQDLDCEQDQRNLNFNVSPQILNFLSFESGLPVKRKLYLQSNSDYLQIFLSHVGEPFEIKTKKVIVKKGKSLIEISFKAFKPDIFSNVLVLSDDEGNSTFVLLKGELR